MRPYYESGGIVLYHGDCREFLPGMDVDAIGAVVTDPPYGISLESNGQRFLDASKIAGDNSGAVGEAVISAFREAGVCVVAFSSPHHPWPGHWRNVLVWDKGEQVGIGGDRETCWKRTIELVQITNNPPLNGTRDGAVLRFPADVVKPSGHVAEKPIDLMMYLVDKVTQPGDLIIDPFCGSGSTLVAAKNIGRKAVGIEIDERWCEVTAERLRQEVLAL